MQDNKLKDTVKIYIIDDNADVIDAMANLFSCFFDHPIQIYKNPLKFLSEFSSSWRGCIITDFFMPVMNGLELIMELKRKNNQMPIIMMSGSCDQSVKKMIKDDHIITFIKKPFKIDELLTKIKGLLKIYS